MVMSGRKPSPWTLGPTCSRLERNTKNVGITLNGTVQVFVVFSESCNAHSAFSS